MTASNTTATTLEWFGVTTFRLRTKGLTIFLDTWLEKPSVIPKYLSIDEAGEVDYIFISHAHFDHLPGADRLAIRTGATVIGNCEAINLLRRAGVPDTQLVAVQGGERLPLFTKNIREQALKGTVDLRPAPPSAPPLPHPSLAALWVQAWPSLHCLMPGHENIPQIMDTAQVYADNVQPYVCTFDINNGMKHGLLKIDEIIPRDSMDAGMLSFVDYIKDTKHHVFSAHDGGQLMYNILIDEMAILWNAHLGAYEGILQALDPKPDVAILGIAGVGNLNGKAFAGSAAEFALREVKLLAEPTHVVWCMHDESPIPPYRVETTAATEMIEGHTRSKVLPLHHAQVVALPLQAKRGP